MPTGKLNDSEGLDDIRTRESTWLRVGSNALESLLYGPEGSAVVVRHECLVSKGRCRRMDGVITALVAGGSLLWKL